MDWAVSDGASLIRLKIGVGCRYARVVRDGQPPESTPYILEDWRNKSFETPVNTPPPSWDDC